MMTLKWISIICFLMSMLALSCSDKVITEKDEETYEPEKLDFGLGLSLGDIPSWFGLGSGSTSGFDGEGDGTDSDGDGQTSGYGSRGFSLGGGGGGGLSAHGRGNANTGFSFGGSGGGGIGTYGGRNSDQGFHIGGGLDFGGGTSGYYSGGRGGSIGVVDGGGSGRDYEGSTRPKDCHCTCDSNGGTRSNGQNARNPPTETVACRPMNCLNDNDCGEYIKKPQSGPPYWCKVPGKGTLPFQCTNAGELSSKLLNCLPLNCPKGGSCGADGAHYVLDIPIWMKGHGSQNDGAYGNREPGYH